MGGWEVGLKIWMEVEGWLKKRWEVGLMGGELLQMMGDGRLAPKTGGI